MSNADQAKSPWDRRVGAEVSINRRILGATVTVAAFTALGKGLSLLKELVVAAQFGRGDVFDAFLIAFLAASFLVNVLAGSLNAALVPAYAEVREVHGGDAAASLLQVVLGLTLAVAAVATAALAIAGPGLVRLLGTGFSEEKRSLTVTLFYLMLPVLAASGLSCVWGAALNAGGRFALAALAQTLLPLVTLGAVLAGAARWGIYALALGTVGGYLAEMLVLVWGAARRGLPVIPRRPRAVVGLDRLGREYLPLVAAGLLVAGTGAVDQAMAAALEPGSVAALSYGVKVVAVLLSLAGALAVAVLPQLSDLAARGDWVGLQAVLGVWWRRSLWLTVPGTLLLVFVSEPLVRLLFERGAFGPSDTAAVSLVQAAYLLQVPFYVVHLVGMRALSALALNRWVLWFSLAGFVLNAILDWLFMNALGAAGIALATSAVYAISAGVVLWAVRRGVRRRMAGQP